MNPHTTDSKPLSDSQTSLDTQDQNSLLERQAQFLKANNQDSDQDTLQNWILEDQAFIDEANHFVTSFNALAPSFFGYPGNLNEDSPMVAYLRKLETNLFYVNNAGDPYEQGDSLLDGKVFERKLLELFYQKFGMDKETSWGYVTSGGSESNLWGIYNGFRKVSNGRLYFCSAAHYSVLKAVTNGSQSLFPYTIIDQISPKDERIDVEKLIEAISERVKTHQESPVLLLTWGTTKTGACDDVIQVTQRLKVLGIPFYLHVDAAYFGGIPNNQIEAPICPSLDAMNAHSVSVSFHKFFGVPNINSVVLSKDKADGNFVSYLGHRDTTFLGSRTFPVLSALQRIKEILQRSPKDLYVRNIRAFEEKLIQNKLSFFRAPYSSIFVVPCPSKWILSRYSLASFDGATKTQSLAHLIINPFHTFDELEALISDLILDQKAHPQTIDL
jgi:histidine decarboxylase